MKRTTVTRFVVATAVALSAAAYLPKAVRKVAQGEAWVPRKVLPKIIERLALLANAEAR